MLQCREGQLQVQRQICPFFVLAKLFFSKILFGENGSFSLCNSRFLVSVLGLKIFVKQRKEKCLYIHKKNMRKTIDEKVFFASVAVSN
jgi:hypothetical protein